MTMRRQGTVVCKVLLVWQCGTGHALMQGSIQSRTSPPSGINVVVNSFLRFGPDLKEKNIDEIGSLAPWLLGSIPTPYGAWAGP